MKSFVCSSADTSSLVPGATQHLVFVLSWNTRKYFVRGYIINGRKWFVKVSKNTGKYFVMGYINNKHKKHYLPSFSNTRGYHFHYIFPNITTHICCFIWDHTRSFWKYVSSHQVGTSNPSVHQNPLC